MLPPRKQRTKIKAKRAKPRRVRTVIKCRAHLTWVVKEFDCSIKGRVCKKTGEPHECYGPIDPDHIKTRGAGGDDTQVWPLCRAAHTLRGYIGLPELERRYDVTAAEIGAHLWSISPAGRACRYKQGRT